MRAIIAAAFLFGCLAARAEASEEELLRPNYVLITADARESFGEVTLEIKTDRKAAQPRITAIRLKVGGAWKTVPKKAFADLEPPDLNTAQIRMEAGYDSYPWLHIYFEVNHKDKDGRWAPRKIHIAYHKGRFEYRSVSTPVQGAQPDWQKLDL